MIAFLSGEVFKVNTDSIYLDYAGMGFLGYMSTRDLSEMTKGDEVFVYTYLQVKEDGMTLFGFLSAGSIWPSNRRVPWCCAHRWRWWLPPRLAWLPCGACAG